MHQPPFLAQPAAGMICHTQRSLKRAYRVAQRVYRFLSLPTHLRDESVASARRSCSPHMDLALALSSCHGSLGTVKHGRIAHTRFTYERFFRPSAPLGTIGRSRGRSVSLIGYGSSVVAVFLASRSVTDACLLAHREPSSNVPKSQSMGKAASP